MKSEWTHSSYMKEVPRTASNQIGTQPEVPRDCTDSARKSCYPQLCLQFQKGTRNSLTIKKIHFVP